MFPKQIAYILFGVIALLTVLFGLSVYSNYHKNQVTEKKINTIIFKFEEKFKNDSIYLANANKLLIDKISQHLIDSVSKSYEKKLEKALTKANKYKEILIANNINITSYSKNKPNKSFSNNSFNKKLKAEPVLVDNSVNNVTTYSKLKNVQEKKTPVSDLNITTYSQLQANNLNRENNNRTNSPELNVTTYSKLNSNTNKNTSDNSNIKKVATVIESTKNVSHNNSLLDGASNINRINNVPIYPGCEKKITEKERKNCFAVGISRHILSEFNSTNITNTDLSKGMHKVRVLFVIDKYGNAKIGKLVGEWPDQIYNVIKNSIASTPKMKPGIAKNKVVPVKYSLLIPFIIN